MKLDNHLLPDEIEAISKYKGSDNIQKLSKYTDRSIYDSNCVEFYEPVPDRVLPGIVHNRYYVSTRGNTLNSNTGGPIGLSKHEKGYWQFASMVNVDGKLKQRTKKLHRYIMETFCPVDNHYEVNHIDGEKKNNDINNLEWCTSSENTIHAINHGLKTVFGRECEVYLTYDQIYTIQAMQGCSVKDIRRAIGNPGYDIVSDISLSLLLMVIIEQIISILHYKDHRLSKAYL